MASDLEGYDSSVELDDHVSISLLPEQNCHRKKKSRTTNFCFKLRAMFGGKAAIYGVVTALLLLSVLLLAVFARPSSSFGTVNKEETNSRQHVEFAMDASAAGTPSLRLPRHLTPIEYEVYLHPNLTTFIFSGSVKVFLYCNEAANNITLHIGKKIHVEEPSVTVELIRDMKTKEVVNESRVESICRIDGEMMVITLDKDSKLERNKEYSLFIEFKSKLSRGLSGFYLSTYYSPTGEKRYLATTHFEPTDARNAFPCFDEPNMKANFTIKITREKRHTALANMPKFRTYQDGDHYIDHFEKSVKMSTYLVAFVVCDFKSIESQTPRGVKVRVWAPPEQIDLGQFALSEAVKVLQFYEKEFQVDYPLPKQDLIAIPDFAAGAMENWGLITYRLTSLLYDKHKSSDSNKQWVAVVVAHELAHQSTTAIAHVAANVGCSLCSSELNCENLIAIPDFATGAMENWGLITFRLTSILYDANKSSRRNKQWVAVVVAHELAHQWFGNLVTMQWWNDLWLNEGFASFVENVGVNFTNPEWKMMDQFYLDKFQTSMALDQLSNSHPIMAEVKDPAQINSLFDTISYDKGASIIRMLEDVLGTNVFFNGLQHYLKTYKFSNAETNDLWNCLTQAVARDKEPAHRIDVKEMMTTWTNQMGFPVITIIRDRGHITARQQHFLIHPDSASPSNAASSWIIPLTFVTQDSDKRHTVMAENRSLEFHLPSETNDRSWIKMNAGQTGFYRVNYDDENWRKLKEQLDTDHQALRAADRAGLLDDAMNLARSGMLNDAIALGLTEYLTNEREYVPWMSALNNLAYFATQFSTYDSTKKTDYYTNYKKYIFYLIKEVAHDLGWEERKEDGHLKRYLRATVLHLAVEYEDAVPEKRTDRYKNRALALFDAWLTRNEPIPPNLRNLVYSSGIKDANPETWNKVFIRYKSETVPSEKRKLMYALTNSRDREILKSLLAYSLQENMVRSQDSVAVINSVAHNPEGRILAWEFVKQNYPTLFKRYGEGSFDFSRLITATTAHFNTPEMKRDVMSFFAKESKGSGERALRQSLESISANIKWMGNNQPSVSQWIQQYVDRREGNNMKLAYYDEIMMMEKYGRP